MNDLRLWANYYYNMGFNVTHINAKKNQSAKNPYKSATNNRFAIQNRRQKLSELQSFDWESSDGIGTVLGFNNLRAIDFDFNLWGENIESKKVDKKMTSFIRNVLDLLHLPTNYDWTVLTPNHGFHVVFLAQDHPFKTRETLTKAFTPNANYYEDFSDINRTLTHLEMRWNKHLVLPPSYNKDGNAYRFWRNCPKDLPASVEMKHIMSMLNEICSQYGIEHWPDKVGDLNKHWEWHYKENDNNDFLQPYDYGEFLDFSPENISEFLDIKGNGEIPQNWIK